MAVLNAVTNHSGMLRTEVIRKKALETIEQNLVMLDLCQLQDFPKNEGRTIAFYTHNRLSAETTALTEGVVPAEGSLTITQITANLAQYGSFVKLSDWTQDILVMPAMEPARDRIEHQARLTVDRLILNELDSNLPNQFANGESALSAVGSSDVCTAKELLKAAITMKKNDVMPLRGDDYVAVLHPAMIGDLFNDSNVGSYNDVHKYTDAKPLLTGEVGRVYGVRVLESSNIQSTTTGTEGSATVYSCPIIGKDACGAVRLGGKNFEIKIKEPGSAGSADPLDQIGSVGWKLNGFVAKYLGNVGSNPHRGVRLRAGSQY